MTDTKMKLPPKQGKALAPGSMVADPGEWRGKTGLIHLVREAVEAVDWPRKKEAFGLSSGEQYPSELLMTLEVYCYARGVYESEAVEGRIRQDEILRELFPEKWPDDRTILKYRRQHHEAIKQCLKNIFEKAFVVRFGEPNSDAAPIDHCVAMALDRWFEPICGPQPDSEAAERLERAIFWDGMAASNRESS